MLPLRLRRIQWQVQPTPRQLARDIPLGIALLKPAPRCDLSSSIQFSLTRQITRTLPAVVSGSFAKISLRHAPAPADVIG